MGSPPNISLMSTLNSIDSELDYTENLLELSHLLTDEVAALEQTQQLLLDKSLTICKILVEAFGKPAIKGASYTKKKEEILGLEAELRAIATQAIEAKNLVNLKQQALIAQRKQIFELSTEQQSSLEQPASEQTSVAEIATLEPQATETAPVSADLATVTKAAASILKLLEA
jgi:hypothetical protein